MNLESGLEKSPSELVSEEMLKTAKIAPRQMRGRLVLDKAGASGVSQLQTGVFVPRSEIDVRGSRVLGISTPLDLSHPLRSSLPRPSARLTLGSTTSRTRRRAD